MIRPTDAVPAVCYLQISRPFGALRGDMVALCSGALIGGKYRLEAPLGQGGMGSVWSARHLALDTVLAIKFIGVSAPDQVDARKRFEREAKAAALLQCPNVVQIHDYGIEGDTPYLVMELLHGEDL